MDSTAPPTTGHRAKKIQDQIITGFVSNNQPYISRLGRFSCQFIPTGTLLICRNYDHPGKIGVVGGRLGKAGVNIRFMSVAPIEENGNGNGNGLGAEGHQNGGEGEKEALMILGVDKPVDEEVRQSIVGGDGVLEASVVML
jgi:D-3-phosphoglycerate dehydrogenase